MSAAIPRDDAPHHPGESRCSAPLIPGLRRGHGPMMMELRDVTKHYPQGRRLVRALNGVSLTIHAGEFVSIMGPSGSGKSTLMHLLGALDVPTSGEVYFQDRPLHSMSDRDLALLRRSKIGFIFQFFNLLPTLTA